MVILPAFLFGRMSLWNVSILPSVFLGKLVYGSLNRAPKGRVTVLVRLHFQLAFPGASGNTDK